MTHGPHVSTKSKLFPAYSSVTYGFLTPTSQFSPATMKPGWAPRGRPSFPSELLKESLCHHSVKSNPIASPLTVPPLPAPTRPNPCLLRAPCNWTPLCQTNLVPISDTPRRRRSSRRSSPHHRTTCFTERTQYCWQPEQTQQIPAPGRTQFHVWRTTGRMGRNAGVSELQELLCRLHQAGLWRKRLQGFKIAAVVAFDLHGGFGNEDFAAQSWAESL